MYRQWTQRQAADVLAIAPPDVSDLVRGKLVSSTRKDFPWTNSHHIAGEQPHRPSVVRAGTEDEQLRLSQR